MHPSSQPYGVWPFTGKATELANAASTQISLAEQLNMLDDYRKAGLPSEFWQSASNTEGAHYRAAAWLAVAYRLSGDSGLLSAAKNNLAQGKMAWKNTSSTAISDILSRAGHAIAQASRGEPNAAAMSAVAKVLGVSAQPEAIETKKKVEHDRESGGIKGIGRAAAETVQDIVKAPQLVLDANKRPWWFFPVLGIGAAITLAVVFRPYFAALTAFRRR